MEDNLTLLKLKPEFQKRLFQKFVKSYKGSVKGSTILNIPASSIRAYKNLYFGMVSEEIIKRLIELKITTQKKVLDNTISKLNKKDLIESNLNLGRKIRHKRLSSFRRDIPKVSKLLKKDYIDLEKWFDFYKNLLNSSFRKILDIKKNEKFINVSYTNFTKNGKKKFNVDLPRKIELDKDFYYFLGLWCGDRSGGKRFGISNKNNEIIKFAESFLKKWNQRIEKILYVTGGAEQPKIRFDKVFKIRSEKRGWVLSVHSSNGILSSFFHYLQSDLEIIFSNSSKQKLFYFFAGLFDAEGNVSLYNKSFRWACKNEKLIDIYSKFLRRINLYDKYDGSCLISYNKERFYSKIFPYLRHDEKIDKTDFLCSGEGRLPNDFMEILKFLLENPKKNSKEIAKALKRKKSYFELKLLSDFGFVSFKGYPHKFEITGKGLRSLGDKNYNSN